MAKLTLQFQRPDFPLKRTFSTARKGDKYFTQLEVGDTVNLENLGGGESAGHAILVAKEKVTLGDVLENADHNHTIIVNGMNGTAAALDLRRGLEACYGTLTYDDVFTILHLLIING